jgi:hypothetical protein
MPKKSVKQASILLATQGLKELRPFVMTTIKLKQRQFFNPFVEFRSSTHCEKILPKTFLPLGRDLFGLNQDPKAALKL